MGNVTSDNKGAGQVETGLHGVLGEGGENFRHWLVQVNVDDITGELDILGVGKVLGGISLELFEEDTITGDFAIAL